MTRIHKHMEEGHGPVWTLGEGYDCPPDRLCWVEVPDEEVEFWIALNKPKPLSPNHKSEFGL